MSAISAASPTFPAELSLALQKGCAYVSGLSLPIDRLYAEAGRFFASPPEVLRKLEPAYSVRYSNQEVARASFRVNSDLPLLRRAPNGLPQGPFDVQFPDFQDVLVQIYETLYSFIDKIMADLQKHTKREIRGRLSEHNLTVFQYPAGQGIESHTDSNALVLVPPADKPGLQILTENTWKEACLEPDHLLVMGGTLLARTSEGLFPPLEHRVAAQTSERHSAIFSLMYY